MAIAYIGYTAHSAFSGDGSDTSVTIPSGATLAVVLEVFWDSSGSGANILSTVTLDGQSGTFFQQNADGSSSPYNSTNGAIITGFTTGASKTLSWTYNSNEAISEGGRIYVVYFSGASSTPVTSAVASNTVGTATSISLNNTATTQYAVILSNCYEDTGPDPALDEPAGSTRTVIVDKERTNKHDIDVTYYTFSSTGSKTYNIATPYFSAIVGVVLEESGGAPASTPKFLTLLGVG